MPADRPARANDAAMQADDQPTPEPQAAAAEPVGPAAEHLNPDAERLNPVAERLPAARWPVQDLHNCDRSYVEHVHAEMRKLGGAAAGLAFVGGGLALLALVWGLPIGEGVKRSLAGLLGVEIILTFGASLNFLVKFGEASLAHPGGEHAPGAAARRRIRVGTYVFGFGFFIAFALFVVAFMYSTPVAVALAIVAVSFACVGTFIAVRAMGVYSQLTLGRLGGDARPLILERPPALLALAGVPVVPLAAFDAVPRPWAAAPTLGGLAVLAGGAALHANRARRALGRLLPKDEAAP